MSELVIIVTGPPGAGKTTVTRILADAPARAVCVHADDFWHAIRKGRIEPWLAEAQQQNEAVVDAVVAASFAYAQAGYEVYVDGIVGPWFLNPFINAAEQTTVPLHYVVLRPAEDVTLARAAGRGAGALTDVHPVRQMISAFEDLGEFERHVLDSSAQSPEQTAAAIRRGLGASAYLVRATRRSGGARPPRQDPAARRQ
ncbi:MAG: AAA family ATPase [Candidatus Dormibacteria bacterium]